MLQMPTPDESAEIARFIEKLEGGYELRLQVTPSSPWLVFHARLWSWSGPEGTSPPRERTFAMWRRTLNIYEEGPDGAVGEDPLQEPEPQEDVPPEPERSAYHRGPDA